MNIRSLKKKLKSNSGKKIVQFSMFVLISFVFWAALTLNENFIFDVKYPVKITNVPDSVTIISDIPNAIKVNVNAKGIYYFKYKLKSLPTINVDYNRFAEKNRILLGKSDLQQLFRDMFGSNSIATSFSPDSINILYTHRKGKPVKLKLITEESSNNQFILNGSITCDQEEVLLYSTDNISSKIIEVETAPIKYDNLNKTTTLKVKVIPPKGMRAVPDSVNVTIPIEPLISKKRLANIEAINVPEGQRLITFPSNIEINYLIPKSLFNNENKLIRVIVDYKDIKPTSKKVPLKLIDIPTNYRGAAVNVDSVEYVIEK